MEKIDQKKFEKLLYDDKDFQKLMKYLSQKTKHVFQIICKERDELTFSRTLKYYLDPSEDHNLNDTFLKSFLMLLIEKLEADNIYEINKFDIDMLDLRSANVYREFSLDEYGRADILIELPEKLFCIIEVKLYSGEGYQQTNRYSDYIDKNVKGKFPIILQCFLTPEGYSSENDNFIAVSMKDLLPVFKKRNIYLALNDENQLLMKNYIRWLKELTPVEKSLKKLCQQIYKKYKIEIDTIVENAPTITAFLKDIGENINKKYKNKFLAHFGSSWITVSPQIWLNESKLRESKKYSSIRVEYNYFNENLYLTLVTPNNEKVNNFIADHFDKIFGKSLKDYDKDYKWNNWGKVYYTFDKMEEFIPENLIDDWEEKVEEYARKIIERAEYLLNILDHQSLLDVFDSAN